MTPDRELADLVYAYLNETNRAAKEQLEVLLRCKINQIRNRT